ncbi:MAG: type I-C CRISPR-associated protein Cas5c [Gammaproteobacteria bacterium]|nr:type I-C CRISPR-associated protein Cas5c [Gammaproteobacteria bacterium]MBU1655677.1 type I-C CRISPR-associated protein Cas5c [Gammaproteobacteria bacterium]MBU1962362.1 type I-C CRISPR-associated protein Cas5c [Gammaproteobacteria bacterium]
MKRFCLEVSGNFACFTRPEMKVERVSYDVITPSAARAVFESILFKKADGRPAVRWHIRKIEVMKPIRWINLRRNELGAVISTRNVTQAMNNGGVLALNIEEERQQRAGLFLRDVQYRLHADMEAFIEPAKYQAMFERRASKGQCFNQPYLGCREFSADFRLIDPDESAETISEDRALGWMLYDLDFGDPNNPLPRFFNARMEQGVVQVPEWESEEVRG